MYLD
jgi:hypothetical protein